jgi:hypothetical protein
MPSSDAIVIVLVRVLVVVLVLVLVVVLVLVLADTHFSGAGVAVTSVCTSLPDHIGGPHVPRDAAFDY